MKSPKIPQFWRRKVRLPAFLSQIGAVFATAGHFLPPTWGVPRLGLSSPRRSGWGAGGAAMIGQSAAPAWSRTSRWPRCAAPNEASRPRSSAWGPGLANAASANCGRKETAAGRAARHAATLTRFPSRSRLPHRRGCDVFNRPSAPIATAQWRFGHSSYLCLEATIP